MHSKAQAPSSPLFTMLLTAVVAALTITLAVTPALAQNSVPPTAVQAAKMPQFASRLAHPARRLLPPKAQLSQRGKPRRGPLDSTTIYENGPANGNVDAWTINYGFVVSDTFNLAAGESNVIGLTFAAWLFPGDTVTSVEISITSGANGGTSYFDQTVNVTQGNCTGNQYGYNVCTVTASSNVSLPSSGTYWVNLQNASVPSGDPVYWDENSGVGCQSPGCPSQAADNSIGSIPSESFTILGEACGDECPTPCFNEQSQNGFRVIHDFSGGADGRYQYGGVNIDQAGNLYGSDCDSDECGGINFYKLSRSGQNWTTSTLYHGVGNLTAPTIGPDGSLYGSSFSYDDVYSLRPSPSACLTGSCPWMRTEIYSFPGAQPTGFVTFDQAGNLYGTTRLGGGGSCDNGYSGCGSVYKLTPSNGGWMERDLYAWTGTRNTVEPIALLVGIDGNLYGRTNAGGAYGDGSVYQLVPSGGGWVQNVLYSFPYPQDLPEGWDPPAFSLIQDSAGNLYGPAAEGGSGFPHGIIFMLSPNNGTWTFSIIRHNNSSGDLFNNLAMDAAGNLYGTGGLGVQFGCGFSSWCYSYIYRLMHSSDGWQFSTPIYFSGQLFDAAGQVSLDGNGSLYGTTIVCGRYGYGTVWQYSP